MYTWNFFVQELVNGLTLGSVYALIALGYSMVYGILKILHFAHGEGYQFGAFILRGYGHGPLRIWLLGIIVIVTTAVLMIALALFVRKTRIGKAMRATSYDREAASMMGIDVDRVIVITFFIGSALAGAAGVMVGLLFERVYHFMGFVAGLKGFTAAVVGGIGSIPGAMLGGIVIGLVEAFSTGYLSSTFYDLIVFGILIAVLLIRPTGLLGKADIKKV